jgi:hypothetical protein
MSSLQERLALLITAAKGDLNSAVSRITTLEDAGGGGGGGAGLYSGLLMVQDQRSAGTDGGRADPNYAKRVINTVVENSITGSSLSGNLVTLPAGSYHVSGWGSFYRTSESTMHLRNSADSVGFARAQTINSDNDKISIPCNIEGFFTLGSSTDLGLWYETDGDNGGSDLGRSRDSFIGPECHTSLTFLKLA